MSNLVVVAVGVVINAQRQILLTQRAQHLSHGGFWEFPGGKVEPEETVIAALYREMSEEVGLKIIDAEELITIEYQYPDKCVRLHSYKITNFQGDAIAREGQLALRWVSHAELSDYQFPAANAEIVKMVVAGLG